MNNKQENVHIISEDMIFAYEKWMIEEEKSPNTQYKYLQKRYEPGTNVKAEMLAVTEVKVSNGVWKFLGWNEESVDNIAEDIVFTGQWEFNPDTESDRDTSVNVAENDIPKTGDQTNIGIYLLIIMLSGFFSALGVAIKK